MGPIIFDLEGMELTAEEKEILQHPVIGGVILFSRNYDSPGQLQDLTRHIKSIKVIPISVDQEGGRVQRFKSGFTLLPSLGSLGQLYDHNPQKALTVSKTAAWLMAKEVLSCGVDLSYVPVLDIDRQLNTVIGNRSFHHHSKVIVELAKAYIEGLNQAGMQAIGKHFPGHGGVAEDTHHELAHDRRDLPILMEEDIYPYQELIQQGLLFGIMPAHVIYPNMDEWPAGLSPFWLQKILRQQLKFDGLIISDDLMMEGVVAMLGDIATRAKMALQAGCDRLLICNNRKEAIRAIEALERETYTVKPWDVPKHYSFSYKDLTKNAEWQQAVKVVKELG